MRYVKIIKDALAEAKMRGNNFGEGGRAAAMLYEEGDLRNAEDMLYTIAVLANQVAELEAEVRETAERTSAA